MQSSSSSITTTNSNSVPVPVPVLSLSPSFNTYSSVKLAQIAATVAQHQQTENDESLQEETPQFQGELQNNNDDDEFEFPFVSKETDSSPISADQIFHNGQIRPAFPISDTEIQNSVSWKPPRLALGKLLIEERDSHSCSSSEADELDGVPAGTYCVWTPKAKQNSPGWCKKSNSTGSSKRWKFKFRDLLHRSNSDGDDTFVFLAPSNTSSKKEEKNEKVDGKVKAKGVAGREGNGKGVVKEVERRRSYLQHRQDLVGLFANVSGMRKNPNLQPYPFLSSQGTKL